MPVKSRLLLSLWALSFSLLVAAPSVVNAHQSIGEVQISLSLGLTSTLKIAAFYSREDSQLALLRFDVDANSKFSQAEIEALKLELGSELVKGLELRRAGQKLIASHADSELRIDDDKIQLEIWLSFNCAPGDFSLSLERSTPLDKRTYLVRIEVATWQKIVDAIAMGLVVGEQLGPLELNAGDRLWLKTALDLNSVLLPLESSVVFGLVFVALP